MTDPLILTSATAGAPANEPVDGSLYAILKWALPQKGWTLAFDDAVNFRAAFRCKNPLGADSLYVRIVDKAADKPGNETTALIESYESMSDVNSGVRASPADQFLVKSNSGSRAWEMVIHPAGFYWMSQSVLTGSDDFRAINWVGHYEPLDSSDGDTFCIHASSLDTLVSNQFSYGLPSNPSATFSQTLTSTLANNGRAGGLHKDTSGGVGKNSFVAPNGPSMDPLGNPNWIPGSSTASYAGLAVCFPMLIGQQSPDIMRGQLPGLYALATNSSAAHFSIESVNHRGAVRAARFINNVANGRSEGASLPAWCRYLLAVEGWYE